MEQFDPKKMAAVWQRVQGTAVPQADTQFLLQRIVDEIADAAVYLSLSRRFRNRESALLRSLYEQEQSHAACLRGIYAMITGSQPELHINPSANEAAAALLRRQYAKELRSIAQYEAHGGDGDYGTVFMHMAQQEREHCRIVLELLGREQKI